MWRRFRVWLPPDALSTAETMADRLAALGVEFSSPLVSNSNRFEDVPALRDAARRAVPDMRREPDIHRATKSRA